jgi:negative regulator of genetic competence, sporulation and motility
MELILINDSKLKIMLSPDDMREYDISCDSVDYKKTETRRAFWCILDDVKHKTGFDAASEKVYIQMYPSKEGGCEMYVTKLGFTSPDESIDIAENASCELAYHFTELDSLLRVCRQLNSIGLDSLGEAYRADNGYYLILGGTPPDSLAFIEEFGKKCDSDTAKTYLEEYGTRICENAAGMLSRFV